MKRCLFFLYGRKFYWEHKDKQTGQKVLLDKETRIKIISNLLVDKEIRRRMAQIAKCSGDKDLQSVLKY